MKVEIGYSTRCQLEKHIFCSVICSVGDNLALHNNKYNIIPWMWKLLLWYIKHFFIELIFLQVTSLFLPTLVFHSWIRDNWILIWQQMILQNICIMPDDWSLFSNITSSLADVVLCVVAYASECYQLSRIHCSWLNMCISIWSPSVELDQHMFSSTITLDQ